MSIDKRNLRGGLCVREQSHSVGASSYKNVANSWAFRFAMSSPSGAGPRTWVLEQRKVPDKVTIYNSVGLVDFATTLVFQSPTDKPTTS
jgi:hypothetical protein